MYPQEVNMAETVLRRRIFPCNVTGVGNVLRSCHLSFKWKRSARRIARGRSRMFINESRIGRQLKTCQRHARRSLKFRQARTQTPIPRVYACVYLLSLEVSQWRTKRLHGGYVVRGILMLSIREIRRTIFSVEMDSINYNVRSWFSNFSVEKKGIEMTVQVGSSTVTRGSTNGQRLLIQNIPKLQ